MKKITLLLLCLFLGVGVADAKKKDRNENFISTREVTLNNSYTGLNVSSMIRVVLEADRNPQQIKIETEGVSAEEVKAYVRAGVLVLSCDSKSTGRNRQNSSRRITVYTGVGLLDSFICSGASSVQSVATIDRPKIMIEAMGVSEVSFNTKCQSLEMELSGSSAYRGNVACSGAAEIEVMGVSEVAANLECGALALELSGSSSYKGNVVSTDRVDIAAMGVSEMGSNVMCRSLLLELSGSSSYKGNVLSTERVDITAMGVSEMGSNVKCSSLALDISGSSLYKGKIDCSGTTSVSLMGVSKCVTTGTTQNLTLDVSGSSTFHGKELACSGAAKCYVVGASNASVYCTGELSFETGQSSDFSYLGKPRILTATVNGSSVRNH